VPDTTFSTRWAPRHLPTERAASPWRSVRPWARRTVKTLDQLTPKSCTARESRARGARTQRSARSRSSARGPSNVTPAKVLVKLVVSSRRELRAALPHATRAAIGAQPTGPVLALGGEAGHDRPRACDMARSTGRPSPFHGADTSKAIPPPPDVVHPDDLANWASSLRHAGTRGFGFRRLGTMVLSVTPLCSRQAPRRICVQLSRNDC
jgi:hypothetical protein